MFKLRRKLFSQNFLHSRKLISKLVRSSSIGKNDLVLEIGPGKGIITEQLLQSAQHVIAVGIDSHWYKYLKNKFRNTDNLTLYHGDFLSFNLPFLPYKVFANIPFSIEGKIIRKLIDAKNAPEDCYLVMMKELAFRLSAPYKENWFSIIHKPWFDFSIYHHFRRTDFTPVPKVDAAMMRFTKRKTPLISWAEREHYQKFVTIGFGDGQPIWQNLKKGYGKASLMKSFKSLHIEKTTKPAELSLQQWISLFRELV
jgi:23S rRNA (adenine-N6)-dimethyltransferase